VIPVLVGIEIPPTKCCSIRAGSSKAVAGDRRRSRCGCRTDGPIEPGRHRSEDASSARESIRRRSPIICASMFLACDACSTSVSQIEALAARLGPVYEPMIVFAAATGLRPSELFGLERHEGSPHSEPPVSNRYGISMTCATPAPPFALRAGLPVFAVSRFMGLSIAMIDDDYRHLARDVANTPSRCLMRGKRKS
jgi:hypothetical protein